MHGEERWRDAPPPSGAARAPRRPAGGLGRRRAALALTGVVALALLTLLGLPRIARRLAVARATALGLELRIEEASLGLGLVRFQHVSVRSQALPSVHLLLERVEVTPNPSLSIRHVEVHGGQLLLASDLATLEQELDAFRRARAPGAGGGSARRAPSIAAGGIDVVPGSEALRSGLPSAWGLRVKRDPDGAMELGVDVLRARHPYGEVEVRGGAISLRQDAGHLRLSGASAREVAGAVNLDERLAEGATPQGTGGKGVPLALAGRLSAARQLLSRHVADGAMLSVGGVRLALRREEQALNIGPATASLDRKGDRVTFALASSRAEGGTPLEVKLESALGFGPVDAEITGGPLSLAALGVKEDDMGLRDVARAQIQVAGKVRLSADASAVALSGQLRLTDITLYQPRLAPEALTGLRASIAGEGELRIDGSHLEFRRVEVGFGKIKVGVDGELTRDGEHARGTLRLGVPLAACSDLLGSAPPALIPLLRGMHIAGTFALATNLAFDTRRPGDTQLEWDLGNECRITSVPADLSPARFRSRFTRTVLDAGGMPTTMESGPGTASWVQGFDLSPHLATAVVVCEDARFFAHGGFDEKAIRSSLQDNLKAGRFVRGASTVTMQLAKNLYLGREKTLSRKLQEAALTLLLEQALSKDQILELYLNVIEFAPGVYGVGPAAWHYFRTRADDLTLAQSLYLISILPNPRNHHFLPDGSLSPRWADYLTKLMRIAHKIGRIDDETLASGLAEILRFGVPSELPGGEPEEGSAVPEIMELSPHDETRQGEP